jgi:glycine/D-amino acid oxidase-like deaminating enzyme
MYTMTPDGEPIIDRLGEHIVAGCGFSGSGFKHSPATGRMLAALASDSDQNWSPGYEWEKYRNDRFQA